MRTGLLAVGILLAACSAGSPSTTPQVSATTGGQPPPVAKPIPWEIKSESNDGYTVTIEFKAPSCEVVKPTVVQSATVTKITLTEVSGCTGPPVTRERRVRLQDHYFPCTMKLIDGGTGKPARAAPDAHLPTYGCPL